MKNIKDKVDISIVAAFHSEGEYAYPMLKSLAKSLTHLVLEGVACEAVLVLDTADQYTEDYITRFAIESILGIKRIVIKKVNFANPGETRNYGIKVSSGTYIAIIDGDDLISENYLQKSYHLLSSKKKLQILHPEYNLSFGKYNEIHYQFSSSDQRFDWKGLPEFNMWTAPVVAHRDVWKRIPYKCSDVNLGFGPEDWQWNLDTLSAGIEHVSVPGIAYFYRRKDENSILSLHEASRMILRETSILRLPKPPRFEEPVIATEATLSRPGVYDNPIRKRTVSKWLFRAVVRLSMPILKLSPRLEKFARQQLVAFRSFFSPPHISEGDAIENRPKIGVSLPLWLIKEWKNQATVEPALSPTIEKSASMEQYLPVAGLFSDLYWRLSGELEDDIDCLFMVGRGMGGNRLSGAVNGFVKKSKLVTIMDCDCEPGDAPEGAKVLWLPKDFQELSHEAQTRLLATLVIQKNPQRVHIINSSIAYATFAHYGRSIQANRQTALSLLFHEIQNAQGNHSLQRQPYLTRYFNQVYIHDRDTSVYLKDKLGIDQGKILLTADIPTKSSA